MSIRAARRAGLVVTGLGVTAALLTGCGDNGEGADPDAAATPSPTTSSSPSATATPSPTATSTWTAAKISKLPDCGEIWQAGHTIPKGYVACREGKTAVVAKRQGCSSGQTLLTHRGHWFGVSGGKVNGTAGAKGRSAAVQAMRDCRG